MGALLTPCEGRFRIYKVNSLNSSKKTRIYEQRPQKIQLQDPRGTGTQKIMCHHIPLRIMSRLCKMYRRGEERRRRP